MTERLLQFIWQFQYFNRSDLETTGGEKLMIVHPGQMNRHQGPDFLEARVRILDELWIGSVELHIDASGWNKHSHHTDSNYNNVILHVVWNNDDHELAETIPTLVLADRVPGVLLNQYEVWMNSTSFIPCGQMIAGVNELVWMSWKQRMVLERLERKCLQVRVMLDKNNVHWDQTLWWMLAKNMGMQVNAEAFEELAESIPFAVLTKHRNQIHQVESILMGQAGLLEDDHTDKYAQMLKKEYAFYQTKYGLKKIHLPVHFLRMRPAAFPTVRLAQLAMLLHMQDQLVSSILSLGEVKKLRSLFEVTANDYWHYHFVFDEASAFRPKSMGAGMVNSIMVNTVAPLLFAYGDYHQIDKYKEKAVAVLEDTDVEVNSTIREFIKLGIKNRDAFSSQALLELKSQYCDKKRCLDCAVGYSILK
jgi:hypothetical protein